MYSREADACGYQSAVPEAAFHPTRHPSATLKRQQSNHVATRLERKAERDDKEVRIRASIFKVVDLDLQQQTWTAIMQVEASWIDRDLVEVGVELEKMNVDFAKLDEWVQTSHRQHTQINSYRLEPPAGTKELPESLERLIDGKKFFAPRIYMQNMIRSERDDEWFAFYKAAKDKAVLSSSTIPEPPIVCLRWKVFATFQQQMDLKRFPFDEQDLTIDLRTGYETTHKRYAVLLVKNLNKEYHSFVNVRSFVQSSEYELLDRIQFVQSETEKDESSSQLSYSRLKITIRVRRRIGYWMTNVVIPMGVVSTSLFATFVLPPNETNDRLAASLTILLAMVTFKYVISDKLPKISYVTLIDSYVLVCFGLAFLTIFTHALSRANVFSEPVLTYMRNYNATARPIDADTAIDVSIAFMSKDTTSEETGEVRVELNLIMVLGVCVWVFLHTIALLLLSSRQKRRRDPFWHAPETAVWIAPLIIPSAQSDEEIKTRILNCINERLKGHKDRHIELRAGELKRTIESETKGRAHTVMLWDPDAAKDRLQEERDKSSKRKAVCEEPLRTTRSFAIVSFTTAEAAKAVVENGVARRGKETNPRLFEAWLKPLTAPRTASARSSRDEMEERSLTAGDPIFGADCTVEPLNPSYYPLSYERRSSARPPAMLRQFTPVSWFGAGPSSPTLVEVETTEVSRQMSGTV